MKGAPRHEREGGSYKKVWKKSEYEKMWEIEGRRGPRMGKRDKSDFTPPSPRRESIEFRINTRNITKKAKERRDQRGLKSTRTKQREGKKLK